MIPYAQPFAAGGVRQPAFVQAANAASNAVAFTSANTAGNLLVVHQAFDSGGGPITSVTDTQGNTWVFGASITNTNNGQKSEVWYCENCRGGPNTVTCTGFAAPRISVLEASGIAQSNSLIATTGAIGTASPVASGNVTPTQSYAYLIGALQMFGATITVGAGWTARSTDANQEAIIHDQVQASAGSVACNPTYTGASNWSAIILAFRPAIS